MNAASMVSTCMLHQQGDAPHLITQSRGFEAGDSGGESIAPSDRGRPDAEPIIESPYFGTACA